jgi:hypothetical protein
MVMADAATAKEDATQGEPIGTTLPVFNGHTYWLTLPDMRGNVSVHITRLATELILRVFGMLDIEEQHA